MYIPDGIDDAATRTRLLKEYQLEIGAGLGPLAGKVWRIGLMGHSCRQDNVMLCLEALGSVIAEKDSGIAAAAGIDAAMTRYAAN